MGEGSGSPGPHGDYLIGLAAYNEKTPHRKRDTKKTASEGSGGATDHTDPEGSVGHELVFGVSDPVARGGGPSELNDAPPGGGFEECSIEHVRLMPGLGLPSRA